MTDENEIESPPENPAQENLKEKPQEVTALTVLGSVFGAWFGVQKEKNRQRDFSSKDPMPFIVAGIIFALVMIIGVIITVNIALSSAGH
jgi:hypothetical protein